MAKPFAVFDIDGTLIRWQLYHALADELVRQGIVDKTAYEAVRSARMDWKRRASDQAFQDYEKILVTLMDKAMKGIATHELAQACERVLDEYKDQVYSFTRDLIADLKHGSYLLFAVSGSNRELVELIAKHYGFDDFGGSEYEVIDAHYTGKKQLLVSQEKPRYLETLVTKHGASWQGSIAVGDSEGDIPMLARVEQPIAFNPTRKLFQHAQTNGWKMVIERKNMWYQLEQTDGSYLLAQTNDR